MTRINSAIPVSRLTDEHLLAEHREIKRLPYFLMKVSNLETRIPKNFTLGKGHVLFFLDKFKFIHQRYGELYQEATKRGFLVTDYSSNFNIPSRYYQSYIPSEEEKRLLQDRIVDRIMSSSKKYWHYYGKRISKEVAIDLLYYGRRFENNSN